MLIAELTVHELTVHVCDQKDWRSGASNIHQEGSSSLDVTRMNAKTKDEENHD